MSGNIENVDQIKFTSEPINFDTFQKVLDIQQAMQLKYYPKVEAMETPAQLLISTRALLHEVIEVEDELNWKHWKSDIPIDYEKVENEIVDIFIFLMNLINASGMSGDELLESTLEKIDINIERQKSGY